MKRTIWQNQYLKLRTELKSIRKEAGLTQVELAAKLDKPQSYVSKYESGEKYLDFIEVLSICKACSYDGSVQKSVSLIYDYSKGMTHEQKRF